MASHSQSARTGRRAGRPRTNACEPCRSAKVKCDQCPPSCSRCSRLKLHCTWPPRRTELAAPRGPGQKQRRILPKGVSDDNNIHQASQDISGSSITDQDPSELALPSQSTIDLDITRSSPGSSFGNPLHSQPLFMHSIVLDDSLVLNGDEYHALGHYQDRFIADRLLKTPGWSMFACIFQSVWHIPMAMHFIIAVSSLDLNRRSPRPAINMSVSRTHFRKGSEMLIQLMDRDAEPDHFSTLSAWLFLYLWMSCRDIPDKMAVDRLSMAVRNYIQRYRLDSLSAGTITSHEQSPASSSWHDPFVSVSSEAGLIGRLSLFLASEDIAMAFEGCGGHLARHVFGNADLYWQIFSQQRYILERHWGESYPEYEAMHDLETTAAMELGSKVGLLFHKVNELSQTVLEEAEPLVLDIETGILAIEREYSSILHIARSRSSATPISCLLRTADAAVSSFYFVKLYYFRSTVSGCRPATPPPQHITSAMADLMNIAHRAFVEQDARGQETFQLPLFMVGIETQDLIHVDWIIPKISRLRFRTALSRIRDIQDQTGCRLSITRIRDILCHAAHQISA